MGEVIRFRRRVHARASSKSRAASFVKASAVNPASLARSVRNSGSQYSDGMLSRCDHLRAAAAPAPTSAANTEMDGHSPTTSRNDFTAIPQTMGQFVPKIKPILSRDLKKSDGQNVFMAKTKDKEADEQYRLEFTARIRAGRIGPNPSEPRWTQDVFARLLGYQDRDDYSKYETRSLLPHQKLTRFCLLTGLSLEYLLDGTEPAKKSLPVAPMKKVGRIRPEKAKTRQRAS